MGMLVLTGKTGMTAAVKRGKTPWARHIIEGAIQRRYAVASLG